MLSATFRRALTQTTFKSTTPVTRYFHQTPIRMASNDKYTQDAEQDLPLNEKVIELKGMIKSIGCSMLTTVATDGKSLHSRAMYPADHENLLFTYIYNNTSHKDDEIAQDAHVNISFLAPTGGDWISVAGKATSTTDRAVVKKFFSTSTQAWFDDKGDGVHDGTGNDPRVSVLQVKPTEIRYFARKKTMVGQVVDIAKAALSADVATPGKIRTITASEIATLQK